jgi:hypothetical protein
MEELRWVQQILLLMYINYFLLLFLI